MGLFNDIFNKMMDAMQENLCDKAKQMLEKRQLKNKLIDMENELDTYFLENYGNEVYFNSLDKYIHDGKVNPDINSNDEESVFYYTLLRAFLNSEDKFLGEERFLNYHWEKIQSKFPNRQYDKDAVKKCFLRYYNVFKIEFGTPSDTDRALVNAVKETVNENSDDILRTITEGNDLIIENINSGIEKISKCVYSEAGGQPSREEICDYNDEYQKRLQDPLFLESDIDDVNIATLKDVYIKPHIDFCFKNLKQWAENNYSRILLLYGKAGIGKTSFTTWLSLNNDFKQKCHILELRKNISTLDSNNPWETIKKCFKCTNDDNYRNKILILDGLDEVCVMKSDFDGHDFINNLCNSLRTNFGRNVRIIITSRIGYFNSINRSNYIEVATILWKEDSVKKWCNKYSKKHTNRAEWCKSFKRAYASLEEKDKRKDVFCTPIILYICCVSQIDISKHDSVASIYDEAFNVMGKRRYNELPHTSQKEYEVNRQFTKELAFQMFLNDMLEDVVGSDFIRIAKGKAVNWAQSKLSYHVDELEFKKLFAINHFAYGKNDAIEFVHKTIGEYFTALKIYEDYFEQINGTTEDIWQNIFNAFRYKAIPEDIMQYLVDIILRKEGNQWKEEFFNAYYTGIENQLLFACDFLKLEYSPSHTAIIEQIQTTFRNLTWLLTGLSFKNSHFVNTKNNLQILLSYFYGDINISGWKNLENINFKRTYLKNANFSSSVLSGGVFQDAILESAKFICANLKGANFQKANLNEAKLTKAYLEGAHFEEACLSRVDLIETFVEGAYFDKACLKEARLEKAKLNRARLTGANLMNARLNGAYLQNAILKKSFLNRAILQEAHLQGAHLEFASLQGAHLEASNFQGAYLQGTHLQGAHLEGAHLEDAHLEGAHLEGAHLEGAHLEGAHLEESHFEGAYIEKTHLENVNFERAHLNGVHLKESEFFLQD